MPIKSYATTVKRFSIGYLANTKTTNSPPLNCKYSLHFQWSICNYCSYNLRDRIAITSVWSHQNFYQKFLSHVICQITNRKWADVTDLLFPANLLVRQIQEIGSCNKSKFRLAGKIVGTTGNQSQPGLGDIKAVFDSSKVRTWFSGTPYYSISTKSISYLFRSSLFFVNYFAIAI